MVERIHLRHLRARASRLPRTHEPALSNRRGKEVNSCFAFAPAVMRYPDPHQTAPPLSSSPGTVCSRPLGGAWRPSRRIPAWQATSRVRAHPKPCYARRPRHSRSGHGFPCADLHALAARAFRRRRSAPRAHSPTLPSSSSDAYPPAAPADF
jgi:hypothetical protein